MSVVVERWSAHVLSVTVSAGECGAGHRLIHRTVTKHTGLAVAACPWQDPNKRKGTSVGALNIGYRIHSVRNASDSFSFQYTQNLIQILVDVSALI